MIETKVLSFSVACNAKASQPVMIEYPELQKMLDQGWEVVELYPPWGSGNVYFQTIQIAREVRRPSKAKQKG